MTMIDPSKPKVKIESAAGDHKSIIQELGSGLIRATM